MANKNCLEGKRCPKCKYEDEVLVIATIWTSLTDEGTDHNADSIKDTSVDYDDESVASCPNCNYLGMFREWNRKKGKRK